MSDQSVKNKGAVTSSRPKPTLMSTGRFRGLGLVLTLALVIRLALLAGSISDHPGFFFQDLERVESEISSTETPYMNAFGFEASNIAHAWVCANQGYASPFGGSTGPTAWIAPGVVAFYVLSFALWGCFTLKSILFSFFIALVCSGITTVVVFHVGSRVGRDPRVGLLAALFFACLPFEAWIFQISGQLDFNLQVMWFAVLLLAVLRAADSKGRFAGLEFGFLSAIAALFNPGLLLCAAVGVVYAIRGRSVRETAGFIFFFTAACATFLGPYVVVQSFRVGGFVPVKSNVGFETYLGNTREARGLLQDAAFQAHHPSQNAAEFVHYGEVGEFQYLRETQRRFRKDLQFREFLDNTVRRAVYFFLAYEVKPWDHSPAVSALKAALWTVPIMSFLGLIVMRRGRLKAAEGLVLLFTLAYSLPYLLTGVMERYRIPMVSAVALFLALLTWELIVVCHERRDTRLG